MKLNLRLPSSTVTAVLHLTVLLDTGLFVCTVRYTQCQGGDPCASQLDQRPIHPHQTKTGLEVLGGSGISASHAIN